MKIFGFITERRAIKVKAAIVEGNKALKMMSLDRDGTALKMSKEDQKTYLIAAKILTDVKNQLDAYYKKHRIIGKIVKFFENSRLFRRFTKKPVIDQLAIKLIPFTEKVQKASEADNLEEKLQVSRAVQGQDVKNNVEALKQHLKPEITNKGDLVEGNLDDKTESLKRERKPVLAELLKQTHLKKVAFNGQVENDSLKSTNPQVANSAPGISNQAGNGRVGISAELLKKVNLKKVAEDNQAFTKQETKDTARGANAQVAKNDPGIGHQAGNGRVGISAELLKKVNLRKVAEVKQTDTKKETKDTTRRANAQVAKNDPSVGHQAGNGRVGISAELYKKVNPSSDSRDRQALAAQKRKPSSQSAIVEKPSHVTSPPMNVPVATFDALMKEIIKHHERGLKMGELSPINS